MSSTNSLRDRTDRDDLRPRQTAARLERTAALAGHAAGETRSAPRRSWRERLLVTLATVIALGCFGVVLLRASVQDRIDSLAMFYYATPPLLVSLPVWLALAIFMKYRRGRAALATGLLAIGCLGWSFSTSWVLPRSSEIVLEERPLRVLFWNCARGVSGWESVAAEIRRHHADIIGLVEAGTDHPGMREFWQREFPGHQVEISSDGIVLLARGTVNRVRHGELGAGSSFAEHEVAIDGQRLSVVVVDISSSLKRPRHPPLKLLTESFHGADYQQKPTLIMGDMNTPTDSVFWRPFREKFSLAFEVAGAGYAATWPAPAPLLTLDQVWVNRQIRVNQCRLHFSRCSDHRAVVTELTMEAG